MTTSFFRFFVFVIFFNLVSTKIKAQQDDFSILMNPAVSLNVDTENRWSYNFGLANRDFLYTDNDWSFVGKHLELSHFTSYEVGFYSKMSLGIRYRFKELFDETVQDETRIIQQYGHSRTYNALKIAYRARFEQRYRERTSFRFRYRFSFEIPLSGQRVDESEFFVVTNTEALWSVGKKEFPVFEHRATMLLGKELANKTKLTLGLQYRYEDYTHNPFSELFLLTKLIIAL